jgi:hypothetical protein
METSEVIETSEVLFIGRVRNWDDEWMSMRKPFEGQVFVEQFTGKVEFSANGTMALDVKEPAPLSESLDLNGLPWQYRSSIH